MGKRPMTLNELVTFLITQDHDPISRYNRAVKLFEFQVALFHGNDFKRLVAGKDSTRLRAARTLATIKILEKIEQDLKEAQGDVGSIQKLAAHQDYCSAFDLFLANGGWSQLLKTSSARWFDNKIAKQRQRVQSVADIVDFLYRFLNHPPNMQSNSRRQPGGVEAAKYVVEHTSKFRSSASAIHKHWLRYSSAAIFLHLVLTQKFDLKPPEVGSAQFAAKLLQQTDNVSELRRYFRAYQFVRVALSNLNYRAFLPLELDLGCATPDLSAPSFTPEMLLHYSDWAKHVRVK